MHLINSPEESRQPEPRNVEERIMNPLDPNRVRASIYSAQNKLEETRQELAIALLENLRIRFDRFSRGNLSEEAFAKNYQTIARALVTLGEQAREPLLQEWRRANPAYRGLLREPLGAMFLISLRNPARRSITVRSAFLAFSDSRENIQVLAAMLRQLPPDVTEQEMKILGQRLESGELPETLQESFQQLQKAFRGQ